MIPDPPGQARRAARVRLEHMHRYPELGPDWYRVLDEDDIGGLWLEAPGRGDPLVSPDRVYVFRRHCEIAEPATDGPF